MASSEPLVSARGVHKSFGSIEVLKGIDLDIAKGEVVSIIGPSGSGKSTILRCINALTPIDRGSIKVDGIEVNDPKLDKRELRKHVAIVFQQFNLFPHKTAIENVMMAPIHVLKENAAEVRERAVALLAKVRLSEKADAYPGELSGGQQQRVAIARSLAMRPKVMLFDEVTSALDPETVKEVLVTIQQLVEEGMTCVLVTHEIGFAKEISNQVCFTDFGVIIEKGTPAEVLGNPENPRLRSFLQQVL